MVKLDYANREGHPGVEAAPQPYYRDLACDFLTEMVKNGIRYCDICDHEIDKGETYVIAKIDKSYFPKGVNVAGSGFTRDGLGNIYMDICMNCRKGLRLLGEEVVN